MIFSQHLFDRYSELMREVSDCILLMQVGAFMQVMDANARSVSRNRLLGLPDKTRAG
jgi:hypothetical protein